MAKDKTGFVKLPGRPFFLFGSKRLWQGPDHLLWVESLMGQEHYRRFYYKDIQAVILQRTKTHHYWSAFWTLPAVLFGIAALLSETPPYISGFLALFFLACLGLNLILGAACIVHLQTAVQTQQVSLGRLKTAQRVMDRLRVRVEQEQGRLDVSAGAARPSRSDPPPGALHAIRPEQDPGPAAKESGVAEPLNPLFHTLLFSVLIAAGLCRILEYATGWIALGFLDLFFIAAGFGLAAVALVRGYHQIKGRWLGHSTWTALIFFILHGMTIYVHYIFVAIRYPDLTMNQWGMLKKFVEVLMSDHPATKGIQLGSAAVSLVLGLSGFLALRKK